jgi:hypothetical protein
VVVLRKFVWKIWFTKFFINCYYFKFRCKTSPSASQSKKISAEGNSLVDENGNLLFSLELPDESLKANITVLDVALLPEGNLIFSTIVTDVTLVDDSGSQVSLKGEAQLCFSTSSDQVFSCSLKFMIFLSSLTQVNFRKDVWHF